MRCEQSVVVGWIEGVYIVFFEACFSNALSLYRTFQADTQYETRNHKTALTWASTSGQMEAMEILLQAEEDLEEMVPPDSDEDV